MDINKLNLLRILLDEFEQDHGKALSCILPEYEFGSYGCLKNLVKELIYEWERNNEN